jgi:hypothetical protein
MKVIRIITAIIVFVSMAFILACSEEKSASLEGHEDIVAVLQKLPQCLKTPDTVNEIYVTDAISTRLSDSAHYSKYKGLQEIRNLKRDYGRNFIWKNLSIKSIKKEADIAHVVYKITAESVLTGSNTYRLSCSAEMVKDGQKWKIKKEKVEL